MDTETIKYRALKVCEIPLELAAYAFAVGKETTATLEVVTESDPLSLDELLETVEGAEVRTRHQLHEAAQQRRPIATRLLCIYN